MSWKVLGLLIAGCAISCGGSHASGGQGGAAGSAAAGATGIGTGGVAGAGGTPGTGGIAGAGTAGAGTTGGNAGNGATGAGGSCGGAGNPCPTAVDVGSGDYHSCAVLDDGQVSCWGDNILGELGDGTLTGPVSCMADQGRLHHCRPTPTVIPGLSSIVQISVGHAHTCAVGRDGSVRCWGENNFGQLGHATTADRTCTDVDMYVATQVPCNPTPAPVVFPSGVQIASVAAGFSHTCALSTAGEVWCWGDNEWGQLGVPLTTTSSVVPVKAGGGTAIPVPATALATDVQGYALVCALAGGKVYCWGGDQNGGTGHDAFNDPACSTVLCSFTPTPVQTMDNVPFTGAVTMAVGPEFGCVTKADGSVWCWGSSAAGGTGQGGGVTFYYPEQVTLALPGGVRTVFGGGGDNVFAVLGSGVIWGWGDNIYGEIGTGTADQEQSTPLRSTFSGAIKISTGGMSPIALKADGSVWVWGLNTWGQLGHAAGTAGDVAAGAGQCNATPSQLAALR